MIFRHPKIVLLLVHLTHLIIQHMFPSLLSSPVIGRTDPSLFLRRLLLLWSKIKYKISSSSAKFSEKLEKLAILPLVWAVGLRRSTQLVTVETTAYATDNVQHFV